MTKLIIHRYHEPTIGDIWQEFAPRIGKSVRLRISKTTQTRKVNNDRTDKGTEKFGTRRDSN